MSESFDHSQFDDMSLEELESRFGAPDPDIDGDNKEPNSDSFCSGKIPSPIWQRLVDDELDGQQYQTLLQQMDQAPELWRDCALAFLEKQAWIRAFSPLGTDPAITLTAPKSEAGIPALVEMAAGSSADLSVSKDSERVPLSAGKAAELRPRGSMWLRRLVVALPTTVAAVFMLSFVFLEYGPSVPTGNSDAPAISGVDLVDHSTVHLVDAFNQLPNEVRQKMVRDVQQVSISALVPTTPASLRERQISASRDFIIVRDADGQRYALPVDSYRSLPLDVQ